MKRQIIVLVAFLSCAPDPQLKRAHCDFGAGDDPKLTLADFERLGARIPIDHIVLVMQENRSFDSYFSELTVPGQTVDGASRSATNPDPRQPGAVARFHQTSYCIDNPAEEWSQVHREIDGGKLDGFTTENAATDPLGDPSGGRAMGYYDESDLPYYYALARTFSISDRHFAAVQANTYPNRLYYFAGTSFGVTDDSMPPSSDAANHPYSNLFTRLNDAKVSWKVYSQEWPTPLLLAQTWADNVDHFFGYESFAEDAKEGSLPSVSIVEGSETGIATESDEDPPADIQLGQAMVANIVSALMASPNWPRAALFLTYDEPGGFYDHVVPPLACIPDDIPPALTADDVVAKFDADSLRVPLIVVSPFAKRGHVSHAVTDHTSILRFVAARFNLPALTHRDGNAVPPFDMFDFDHPDTSIPALPNATIDASQLSACIAKYAGSAGVSDADGD